jgi:hypothetical protein
MQKVLQKKQNHTGFLDWEDIFKGLVVEALAEVAAGMVAAEAMIMQVAVEDLAT